MTVFSEQLFLIRYCEFASIKKTQYFIIVKQFISIGMDIFACIISAVSYLFLDLRSKVK